MQQLVLNLRNGAVLATLAATPILVGFLWNAVWGAGEGVTVGTYTALLLAWLAALGVVAGISYSAHRDGSTFDWFYPCTRCKKSVAIFSYRCMRCKTPFRPPPQAHAFRNALLLGAGVFYATFTLGAFLLRQ